MTVPSQKFWTYDQSQILKSQPLWALSSYIMFDKFKGSLLSRRQNKTHFWKLLKVHIFCIFTVMPFKSENLYILSSLFENLQISPCILVPWRFEFFIDKVLLLLWDLKQNEHAFEFFSLCYKMRHFVPLIYDSFIYI